VARAAAGGRRPRARRRRRSASVRRSAGADRSTNCPMPRAVVCAVPSPAAERKRSCRSPVRKRGAPAIQSAAANRCCRPGSFKVRRLSAWPLTDASTSSVTSVLIVPSAPATVSIMRDCADHDRVRGAGEGALAHADEGGGAPRPHHMASTASGASDLLAAAGMRSPAAGERCAAEQPGCQAPQEPARHGSAGFPAAVARRTSAWARVAVRRRQLSAARNRRREERRHAPRPREVRERGLEPRERFGRQRAEASVRNFRSNSAGVRKLSGSPRGCSMCASSGGRPRERDPDQHCQARGKAASSAGSRTRRPTRLHEPADGRVAEARGRELGRRGAPRASATATPKGRLNLRLYHRGGPALSLPPAHRRWGSRRPACRPRPARLGRARSGARRGAPRRRRSAPACSGSRRVA